jgi:hypothetical protein
MVRRRWAAGIGVALLIVIVLVVNGCLSSQQQTALKDYNRNVSRLARESDEQVSRPFFSTLSSAAGKSALSVEVQVDQLRIQAQNLANRARAMSVPSEMNNAHRNLLAALDLRVEALTKIAALLPTALGGGAKQASIPIAGDMEILLASDVLYSQRVAPWIQQTLSAHGIHGVSTAASRSLPNLGWLEPATVEARMTGHGSSATRSGAAAPGTHGSSLTATHIGETALEAEPTLNHITGGANQTVTAAVEDAGENAETNVKVEATITAAGKQVKGSKTIEKTEPGKTTNVEIPITGIPLGVASKLEVSVEPVPGETDVENNKATYLAVFEK